MKVHSWNSVIYESDFGRWLLVNLVFPMNHNPWWQHRVIEPSAIFIIKWSKQMGWIIPWKKNWNKLRTIMIGRLHKTLNGIWNFNNTSMKYSVTNWNYMSFYVLLSYSRCMHFSLSDIFILIWMLADVSIRMCQSYERGSNFLWPANYSRLDGQIAR